METFNNSTNSGNYLGSVGKSVMPKQHVVSTLGILEQIGEGLEFRHPSVIPLWLFKMD